MPVYFDFWKNPRWPPGGHFWLFSLHNKFVCQRLDLRDGLTDFLATLHDIGTWCVVAAHLCWFLKKSKMAAWRSFLEVFIAQFACQRLVLRHGRADLLEILHRISTWCVVVALVFWFLKISKMAAWRSFFTIFIAQFARQRLVLQYSWAYLLEILHGISSWCIVDAHLF